MTQPAKVQEPSMEEILASIRRIIADDEGKAPVAEKAASPPPAPAKPEKPAAPPPKPVMTGIPPSTIPAAQTAAAKAPASSKPAPSPPPPTPEPPAVSNNQDDIDALLSGLDEATSVEEIRPLMPDADVFELTDEMAVVAEPVPQPSFHKIEPQDELEFTEPAAKFRQPEPPPFETPSPQPILSRHTVSAVESAFNTLA